MQVLNAPEQLNKGQPRICLIVGASFQDRIQKLAACQELCDEIHLVAFLKVLFQEDHVLVVHAHQNVDLLEDVLPVSSMHQSC